MDSRIFKVLFVLILSGSAMGWDKTPEGLKRYYQQKGQNLGAMSFLNHLREKLSTTEDLDDVDLYSRWIRYQVMGLGSHGISDRPATPQEEKDIVASIQQAEGGQDLVFNALGFSFEKAYQLPHDTEFSAHYDTVRFYAQAANQSLHHLDVERQSASTASDTLKKILRDNGYAGSSLLSKIDKRYIEQWRTNTVNFSLPIAKTAILHTHQNEWDLLEANNIGAAIDNLRTHETPLSYRLSRILEKYDLPVKRAPKQPPQKSSQEKEREEIDAMIQEFRGNAGDKETQKDILLGYLFDDNTDEEARIKIQNALDEKENEQGGSSSSSVAPRPLSRDVQGLINTRKLVLSKDKSHTVAPVSGNLRFAYPTVTFYYEIGGFPQHSYLSKGAGHDTINNKQRTAYRGKVSGRDITLLEFETVGAGPCAYASLFQSADESRKDIQYGDAFIELLENPDLAVSKDPFLMFLLKIRGIMNRGDYLDGVDDTPFQEPTGTEEFQRLANALNLEIYIWYKEKNGVILGRSQSYIPNTGKNNTTRTVHIGFGVGEGEAGHYNLMVPADDAAQLKRARPMETYIERHRF